MAVDDYSAGIQEENLPAQATGNTLPGAAASLTNIEPAPTPEESLLQASFGDRGAAQYNALRQANQAAAPTPVPPAPPPAAAPSAAPATPPGQPMPAAGAAPMGGGLGGLLSTLLGGVGTTVAAGLTQNPNLGLQQQLAQAQIAKTTQLDATKLQGQATADFGFLKTLKDVAPQYRPQMVLDYFRGQGRNIPPSIAAMVSDQSTLATMTSPEIEQRLATDPNFANLYFNSIDKPKDFLTLNSDLKASHAKADEAIDKAHITAAQAPFAADNAQLENERKQQSVDQMAQKLMQDPVQLAKDIALAKQNVSDTAATRTMREAAPHVLSFVDRIEKSLDRVSTGPAASRYQEFMAGKIGAPNPQFTDYRTNVHLMNTLLMRMHSGRGSEYLLKEFKDMMDAGKQSPENMRAALNVVREYATDLIHERGMTATDTAGAPSKTISAADFLAQ